MTTSRHGYLFLAATARLRAVRGRAVCLGASWSVRVVARLDDVRTGVALAQVAVVDGLLVAAAMSAPIQSNRKTRNVRR